MSIIKRITSAIKADITVIFKAGFTAKDGVGSHAVPLTKEETAREDIRSQEEASKTAAKALRAELWPQPDATQPPWSKAQEQQARDSVVRAFSGLSERRGEHAVIKTLSVLASRGPAGRTTHLQWIDAESKNRHFLEPLIAQAAAAGNELALDAFLKIGADPNAQDHQGRAPIWHAMQAARRAILNSSVFYDKSAQDATALAAFARTEIIVRRLLLAGADANGMGTGIEQRAKQPLLFDAAALASKALTQTLLEFGARADAVSQAGEPLLCSLAGNSPKCVMLFESLVQAGASLEARDPNGDTALLAAARWHSVEAARELMRLGAKQGAASRDGLTWREVAREAAHATDSPLPRGAQACAEFMALIESLEIQEAMAGSAIAPTPNATSRRAPAHRL